MQTHNWMLCINKWLGNKQKPLDSLDKQIFVELKSEIMRLNVAHKRKHEYFEFYLLRTIFFWNIGESVTQIRHYHEK